MPAGGQDEETKSFETSFFLSQRVGKAQSSDDEESTKNTIARRAQLLSILGVHGCVLCFPPCGHRHKHINTHTTKKKVSAQKSQERVKVSEPWHLQL